VHLPVRTIATGACESKEQALLRTFRFPRNKLLHALLVAVLKCCVHGQALVLLGAMWEAGAELQPDTVSYNAALKACGSAREIATAMQACCRSLLESGHSLWSTCIETLPSQQR
jgi:hypothetical protein